MHEKIKKIGKILLVVVGGLIAVFIVGAIILNTLSRTSSMPQEAGYYGSGNDVSGELGLGSALPSMNLFGSADEKKYSRTTSGNRLNERKLTDKKIIKNGDLSLYVKDAEESVKRIKALAGNLGGFVSSSNIYESSAGVKSGNITIRIPVDKFERAINNVKELAVEVERENITARDVTEQYIDYEAQLKNLRAEEARYLEIMKDSATINDTLQVANRLSDVRGRIESIQGKLKYLSRQVDMSSIRITLSADDDIKVFGLRWKPLVVLKRAVRNMFLGLSGYIDAMIGIVFYLPVLILWFATIIFILIVIWRILKWIYRKFLKNKDKEII